MYFNDVELRDLWIMTSFTVSKSAHCNTCNLYDSLLNAALPPPSDSAGSLTSERLGRIHQKTDWRKRTAQKMSVMQKTMNKGPFNEEASLLLTLPLPIQLFFYSEREVRAAGLQSWFYWRPTLTRSKHN